MPRYHYIAVDVNGKKAKGTLTAESAYAARKQLRMRSIHPTNIKEVSGRDENKGSFAFLRKSSKSQLVDFTRQMAILLNSGIKLTEALSVMILQASDSRFKTTLTDIRDRVVTGESLTDALKDYSDYFDVIYVSMVRVGEVTGSLGGNFARIASFMEKRQKVESKIITAMVYPAVLFCAALLAVFILMKYILPEIVKQIIKTGQELPWITKALMNVSYVLRFPWIFLVIGGIIFIIWSIRRFLATEKGSYLRDKTMLSLPVIGNLVKQRVVSRFASTLSALLNSGLGMAESLKVVAEVTGNSLMKKAIQQARERILAGADIATPLKDSGVIDPAIAHMVTVGEKSGELDIMLQNISDSLESQADIVIERLSSVIEPVIIILVAVMVGTIAIAVLLPILRLSSQAI